MAPKLPTKKVFRMPNNIFDTTIFYDDYEDGFLREGPARLLGMTAAADGSWTHEPLDGEEDHVSTLDLEFWLYIRQSNGCTIVVFEN